MTAKNKPRTRTPKENKFPTGQVNSVRGKKVICAMSGGVDSSVAAALLKKEGFNVVGVFMKFWSEPRGGSTRIYTDKNTDLHRYENRCCTSEAEVRARKVAKILKIPFYVFNFEKEFKKRIVDYFLKEYKAGRTPNPCVVCNKEIKFGLLLEKALDLGINYVATGHYARLSENKKKSTLVRILKDASSKERYRLLKAKDKEKDQSYFLWMLSQNQLKRILFPIGDYTKEEVKNLAKKFKLPVFDAPESMEICFIQTTVNDFLKKYFKERSGDIVNKEGEALGRHQGLWFYTIGQRKGIGLPGGPYYVLDKDPKKNSLIITKNEKDLYRKELMAKKINWISGKEPKFPLKVKVKIRYRHKSTVGIINPAEKGLKVIFKKAQRAITPGQSVVFYQGKELLGGGIIS